MIRPLVCIVLLLAASWPATADTLEDRQKTFQRVKTLAIWQHGWHMREILRWDEPLSEACRKRHFNQRYFMLHKALFAQRYWVGVAWKNPNVLVDREGLARRDQIYYFHRDGGRDGYDQCDVYVQDLAEEFVVE
jgi:hypothetical protein